MAYAQIGLVYLGLFEPTRAAESVRRAYELRERTSEQEKFFISSLFDELVTGNLEAALVTYKLWGQTYPRDYGPQIGLYNVFAEMGEYWKALAAGQQALRVNSGSSQAYGLVVNAYLFINRLDEAKAAAHEAEAQNLDGPYIQLILYYVDFLQHDAAGMERVAAKLMEKPGYEDNVLDSESDTAAYHGEFAKARELTRRAEDSAQREDEKETAAGYKAEVSVRETLVGNMVLAKQEARGALALSNGKDVEALSAVALGLAGDSAQASRLAGDLEKRFAEDTFVKFRWLPMIYATVALRSSDAGKAVKALGAAAPYELGWCPTSAVTLYPAYLRGEAFLAAKQGTAAGVEFQKILDHPGAVANEPIGALAHLGLGRAYALARDSAKAKTAYQDFFALWKNADPDIPILRQAKSEYAKVK